MEELQLVWGWQPALYLFLGGMGAGAFIAAAILFLIDDGKNRRIANTAMWASALCLMLGLLLLLTELITPLRGLLLWQSFSNITSWMTIGAWVVLAAVLMFLMTAVLTLPSIRNHYRLKRAKRAKRERIEAVGKVLAIVGIMLGLGVAIYTGILLMWVPGVPLWRTFLLPCLFTVSALDTGVALVEIIALVLHRRSPLSKRSRALLERSVIVLVVLEAAVLAVFTMVMFNGNAGSAEGSDSFSTTAVVSIQLLVTGELAPYFWTLFVGCGLVIPLVSAIIGLAWHKRVPIIPMALGAIAALAGGCTLRFLILLAGKHVDLVSDTVLRLVL
jgi:formate-dependent nitrite reductase membrane component NrfD